MMNMEHKHASVPMFTKQNYSNANNCATTQPSNARETTEAQAQPVFPWAQARRTVSFAKGEPPLIDGRQHNQETDECFMPSQDLHEGPV